MAKKSYKVGDIIKVSQIEKMDNVFVFLEFDKELKLLSETEKNEGKILYIKEIKTENNFFIDSSPSILLIMNPGISQVYMPSLDICCLPS